MLPSFEDAKQCGCILMKTATIPGNLFFALNTSIVKTSAGYRIYECPVDPTTPPWISFHIDTLFKTSFLYCDLIKDNV